MPETGNAPESNQELTAFDKEASTWLNGLATNPQELAELEEWKEDKPRLQSVIKSLHQSVMQTGRSMFKSITYPRPQHGRISPLMQQEDY